MIGSPEDFISSSSFFCFVAVVLLFCEVLEEDAYDFFDFLEEYLLSSSSSLVILLLGLGLRFEDDFLVDFEEVEDLVFEDDEDFVNKDPCLPSYFL